MSHFVIVPGIGGSGDAHWQSFWENANPAAMRRIRPASWDRPDLADWIAALDAAVAAAPVPPILVAHSLGCLLVAHWQADSGRAAQGAFLVATPDPDRAAFPAEAAEFARPPETPLRFPSLMVASDDDPYGDIDYATARAARWGSRIVFPGRLGHINGASGLGAWPDGRRLLDRFVEELP